MLAHIRRHLGGQIVAAVIHCQHNPLDFQGFVEVAPHQLDGAHQLGQTLEGKELRLQRHQHGIRRGHGVHRQKIQRRRAIDQDVIAMLAHARQCPAETINGVAQAIGPARRIRQFELGAGQIHIRGNDRQTRHVRIDERILQRALTHQNVIGGRPAIRPRNPQPGGRVALGIEIQNNNPLTDGGERGRQIDGGRGLAHAPLLVRHGNDLGRRDAGFFRHGQAP